MIFARYTAASVFQDEEPPLYHWQKKVFNFIFTLLVPIGMVPWIWSLKTLDTLDEWRPFLLYTALYVLMICVALLSKVPFRIRIWMGAGIFYGFGLLSLFVSGITLITYLYLFCFSTLAAIFSGKRGSAAALTVNFLTLISAGLLIYGRTGTPSLPGFSQSLLAWISSIGGFMLVSAGTAFLLALVLRAFETAGIENRLLLNNTSDTAWILDKSLDFKFISKTLYKTFGYLPEEITGKDAARFFSPDIMDAIQSQDKKDTAFRLETQLAHKSGHPVPVEVCGEKIERFPGGHARYQGLIKDITKQKEQEAKIAALEDELARAQKLKSLGILAGSVAHDLNNILSGIATYPEVLMMDTSFDPATRQGLEMIRDSGQKASAVVRDLLTISRGAGAEMEILNINAVIDRYLVSPEFSKTSQAYRQVAVDINTEPELLNIKGSYLHIEKTVMNLFLNAVEEVAQKEDGKVVITTANAFVDPSTLGHEKLVQGEYVVLSVTDNGTGIDENDLDKIFNPFFTKKEMGKSGTGLGLNVVWNTVQDHGGTINVVSGPNGTRFELFFPATRQEIPRKSKTESFDEIKGRGELILVVDDLQDQQGIALQILKNLGYRAHAVDNGYAAVDFIEKNPVDLVILDMVMPASISGLETFKQIKKTEPGQKAIIASGYSESEDVLMAQSLGAGTFVKKPYTVLDMGIAIKEELEK